MADLTNAIARDDKRENRNIVRTDDDEKSLILRAAKLDGRDGFAPFVRYHALVAARRILRENGDTWLEAAGAALAGAGGDE